MTLEGGVDCEYKGKSTRGRSARCTMAFVNRRLDGVRDTDYAW